MQDVPDPHTFIAIFTTTTTTTTTTTAIITTSIAIISISNMISNRISIISISVSMTIIIIIIIKIQDVPDQITGVVPLGLSRTARAASGSTNQAGRNE